MKPIRNIWCPLAILVSAAGFALAQPAETISGRGYGGVYGYLSAPVQDGMLVAGRTTYSNSGCQANGGCYGTCANFFQDECGVCSECGCAHQRVRPNGLRNFWLKDQAYFQSSYSPPCPGFFVNQILEAQKANGRVAQMAFYSFHFEWNSLQERFLLSSSGWNNARNIVSLLPETPGLIMVQPWGDPIVDQLRLQLIRDSLASLGVHDGYEIVVLGQPGSVGVSGVEATKIYDQRMMGSPLNPIQSMSRPTTNTGSAGANNSPTPK